MLLIDAIQRELRPHIAPGFSLDFRIQPEDGLGRDTCEVLLKAGRFEVECEADGAGDVWRVLLAHDPDSTPGYR